MYSAAKYLLFVGIGFWGWLLPAQANEHVERLLARDEAPPGVVFEILSDQDGLQWALPQVRELSGRLRQQFPALEITVVSHGREELALLKENRERYGKVHQQVQSLVADDEITVHVCGTYASWHDRTPEDFPDYVNVSAAGPAQINDYRALGYEVVRLRKGDN
jgi:intracellular sulfur oxidation DsrE/DsrF family protein